MNKVLVMLYVALAAPTLFPGAAFGDVNIGGDIVVEEGRTADNAISFGGAITIRGTVSGDAVAIGGSVVVESGGRALGDAVAFGGDVIVRDNASVGGDAVTIGGMLQIAPGGTVGGEHVRISGPGGRAVSAFLNSLSRIVLLGPFAGIFGVFGALVFFFLFLIRMIIWIAVAALFYYLFPVRIETMADSLRPRFWAVFLYGLLFLVLIPFMFLFLLVSLIGIPLIPVAAISLFLLYLYGSAGVALWAGKLLPDSAARSGMLNLTLGVLAISFLRLIPGLGIVVWLFLTSVSLGVTVITRLGEKTSIAP